ncbi:hypothetical protein D3C81_904370 [compost metagenome]
MELDAQKVEQYVLTMAHEIYIADRHYYAEEHGGMVVSMPPRFSSSQTRRLKKDFEYFLGSIDQFEQKYQEWMRDERTK